MCGEDGYIINTIILLFIYEHVFELEHTAYEIADTSNITVPIFVLLVSPSPLSSASEHMSPKMKWIFSLARSSVEAPWSELQRMSAAKRALMELGHVAFARSGSVGPIIALHSSTAFSLFRMSIIQGPLVNKTVWYTPSGTVFIQRPQGCFSEHSH